MLAKTHIFKKPYLSMMMIVGHGKDHTPNGLGGTFDDLWTPGLVHAYAVWAMSLLEGNIAFNQ